MDPLGTPKLTGSHVDDWPFKTAIWKIWLGKMWISSSSRPVTLMRFTL